METTLSKALRMLRSALNDARQGARVMPADLSEIIALLEKGEPEPAPLPVEELPQSLNLNITTPNQEIALRLAGYITAKPWNLDFTVQSLSIAPAATIQITESLP
jgi:hypothetical protein